MIFQYIQHSLTSSQHILPGGLEVTRIPGVCDLGIRAARILHQQMQFAVEIAAADAMHVPKIGSVHPNQEVEAVVVLVPQLAGRFAGAVDAMLGQLAAGRGIDRIADLLGAGGGGFDVELALQPSFPHQVLHHELGHWAAAYVPVTNKKYPRHCFSAPFQCYFLQCSTLREESRAPFPGGRMT